MKQKYRYGTNKYISLGERFGFRLKILMVFIAVILIAGGALLYDVLTNESIPQTPTSPTRTKNVAFDNKSFSSPYFRFTDTGDWKFIANQSTPNKIVFQKYLPNSELVQHQLFVYVNTTVPSLELATSRVLPVEINDENNKLKPLSVSDHCGASYKSGELHRVQSRQLNGATLLCDPEQGQFRVVFAKVGGDYNLKLKRADGSVANYIIIYQNQKIDPDPDTVMQIADSFQSL
jgi:hypothetical protein